MTSAATPASTTSSKLCDSLGRTVSIVYPVTNAGTMPTTVNTSEHAASRANEPGARGAWARTNPRSITTKW
jgi:hypothetical protein